MSIKASLILAPILLAAACASDVGTDPGNGPGSSNPDPSVSQLQGEYDVNSKYDLRQSGELPDFVSDALGPLTSISDNPAHALLEMLEGTDSGVAELIEDLPSFLRTMLETEVNNYLQQSLFNNNQRLGTITEYVDMIASALTDFEVMTSLKVEAEDASGNAKAVHALTGIAFAQNGGRIVVDTPSILNSLSAARNVDVNVDFSNRTLALGEHSFEIPLGEFSVIAFHQAVQDRYGVTDMGRAFGEMANCDGLGVQVGDLYLGDIRVLSESQISEFCFDAFAKLPAKIDAQIRKLGLAEIQMTGGQGGVQMSSATKVISVAGQWDAMFAINDSGISMTSDFSAKRK